jgi:hypothetical protein
MPLPDPLYRSSDGLSAIVYCPDMEKTDDVANRNPARPRTPDGCSSPACQRQCPGDEAMVERWKTNAC